MRSTAPRRRHLIALLSMAMLVAAVQVPSAVASGAGANAGAITQAVSPSTIAWAMRASGSVVRREGALTVERIRGAEGAPPLYRLTLNGAYPPRALRYLLEVDSHAVAYGIPGPRGRSLQAVTADPSVLTGSVSVRYGTSTVPSASVIPPSSSAGGPAPAPRAGSVPAMPGPYEVTRRVYDLGDQVFQPSDLGGKVEITADVHFPTGLPDGPYPLVLFLHGNHAACFKGNDWSYRWPCKDTWEPLPNYTGYDYVASRLASYGYVVVSVSGNGVNVLGNVVDDSGMRQRGELLEEHLDLWKHWSTVGGDPFGTKFVDNVDMTRIGTMGHSRGGEGVVWQVIVDRERPNPYGIDAVLPLAPVDFTRATINDVSLAVMLPYCDGDVSDLQGIHFYDDARYLVDGDRSPKHAITVFGANHNFFNTVWTPGNGYPGAFDDGLNECEGRLRPVEERRVGSAYIVNYFRRYLGRDTSLDPIFTGAEIPDGIAPARTAVSYLAPDTWRTRLDVDRFTDATSLARNELGGTVIPKGLSVYGWCADTFENPCITGLATYADVHLPGLAQGVLGWSDERGNVRFHLPEGTGAVRRFDALQVRTSINPGYDVNRAYQFQDLSVVLVDGAGHRSSVAASDVGNDALAYPSGLRRFYGHVILQQLRFPLSAFTRVDLRDIRSVQIRFDRTMAGVIDVADLNFSAGAP
jgi:hypothetical protein